MDQVASVTKCKMHRSCIGFTLIELLTVIAIVGVLVAILLPAVQSAREAASRTGCMNNLHQIGIALHNYHDANRTLPVGCIEWRGYRAPPTARQFAWSAMLLPFLEQQPLHARIDFSKPFDHTVNARAASIRLKVFECPSALNRNLVRGQTDYGGLYGEIIVDRQQDDGIFLYERRIAFRDIIDGLSNTIAVSEDIGGPDSEWINGRNVFVQSGGINDPTAWIGDNEIRSKHTGGATVLFADARVMFMSNSTDKKALGQGITRAKGEIGLLDN
jgi:prepilin-type N-terminal cleavage/methylation domain-containing protein